jgi:dihydroneopterin aldolase/2-amino-4-hydroxy-6-hydroxymethyldihydropteridine diphosphokinase
MTALTPGPGVDLIEVRGIRARGHHGVLESERVTGQTFVADVIVAVDTQRAAGSDDLADTVDYSQVAQAVHAELAGDPVDLIETLAERIAARCLAFAGVQAVEVALHKPEAPVGVPVSDVILRIARGRT